MGLAGAPGLAHLGNNTMRAVGGLQTLSAALVCDPLRGRVLLPQEGARIGPNARCVGRRSVARAALCPAAKRSRVVFPRCWTTAKTRRPIMLAGTQGGAPYSRGDFQEIALGPLGYGPFSQACQISTSLSVHISAYRFNEYRIYRH
jgi:hypothetical protein